MTVLLVWRRYGPHSPNCTSDTGTHPFNCGDGCLFDLDKDWTEHVNLKATQPADFKRCDVQPILNRFLLLFLGGLSGGMLWLICGRLWVAA